MSSELAAIGAALDPVFALPIETRLDEAAFNALALRIFAFQFENNAPYAAWCRRRRRTPEHVEHWAEVPAVPAAAFKEVVLLAGSAAQAVFRTSGTSTGWERRGAHHIPDLSLYHRSLLAGFRAMLLPDGAAPAMLSLLPSTDDWRDSSLAHMVSVVSKRLGSPRSAAFASADARLDIDGLVAALHRAEAEGEPACLLGTSFSFVHALDALAARGARFRLPAGSRLMDTGGFKGRSREVGEDEMRVRYTETFGIPAAFAVNEYGMTEMCSQFYDTTLHETVRLGEAGPRRKRVPPWVRTRIVDPESLEPVAEGRAGLLQHFDLANAGSVMAVQTEDVGVGIADGFRVLGRAAGAPPRGCSIAVDELLAAALGRGP